MELGFVSFNSQWTRESSKLQIWACILLCFHKGGCSSIKMAMCKRWCKQNPNTRIFFMLQKWNKIFSIKRLIWWWYISCYNSGSGSNVHKLFLWYACFTISLKMQTSQQVTSVLMVSLYRCIMYCVYDVYYILYSFVVLNISLHRF